MFRILFGLFALVAPCALLVCLGNLIFAGRTWILKRPANGLGAFTARHRFYWQLVLFGFCLCLNALVTAVFLFSNPGNSPRNASGWVLYCVLWFFLVGTTFLSVDQRLFDHKVKTYPLGNWDGIERRR